MPTTGNYYYTEDHLGNIRELTDSTGAVRARYDYDLYGRRTKVSGDLDADFGFTGYYYHAPSALEMAPYRVYAPNLGRWLSRDPAGEKDGPNLFDYVGNDPLNAFDLTGLSAIYRLDPGKTANIDGVDYTGPCDQWGTNVIVPVGSYVLNTATTPYTVIDARNGYDLIYPQGTDPNKGTRVPYGNTYTLPDGSVIRPGAPQPQNQNPGDGTGGVLGRIRPKPQPNPGGGWGWGLPWNPFNPQPPTPPDGGGGGGGGGYPGNNGPPGQTNPNGGQVKNYPSDPVGDFCKMVTGKILGK